MWQQLVGCDSSWVGMTAVWWVWQQLDRCGSSLFDGALFGWLWQSGGCGSDGVGVAVVR